MKNELCDVHKSDIHFSDRYRQNVLFTTQKESESYLSQHMRIQNSLYSCNSRTPQSRLIFFGKKVRESHGYKGILNVQG